MTQHQRPMRYVVRREIMTDKELREAGWDLDESRRAPHPNMWTVHAYAVTRGGQERPVAHFERHSGEFEFGYGGSGPAELARCLLIDWFGLHDAAAHDPKHVEVPVDYEAFKRHFIALVSHDEREFSIDATAIQCLGRRPAGTRVTRRAACTCGGKSGRCRTVGAASVRAGSPHAAPGCSAPG